MKSMKKVWSSILSLALTACLLGSGFPSSVTDARAASGSIEQPEPGNGSFFIPEYSEGEKEGLLKKEAVPVEGMDGYYDITLTLQPPTSSEVTTTKKTDIVLVIDKSASMTNGNNILGSVKSAANDLVDKVLTESLQNSVRVAVVAFSGPNQTNATATEANSVISLGFSNSASEVTNYINTKISASGGTNTEAGFKKAYDLLKTSTAEQKFVVFLSDGGPTFRLTKVTEDAGRNTVYYGTGSNDEYGYNATCALAWANALKAGVEEQTEKVEVGDATIQPMNGLDAKIFSVGYGVDTSAYASPDTEDVTYYYPASQAGQISNIFKLIQQTITNSMAASQIVVKDIVTDDFTIVTPAGEVAVAGQELAAGQQVTIDGNTVSVPLGTIISQETSTPITITFRVKVREDRFLEAGDYLVPTNTRAEVTYRQDDEEWNQVFEVPGVNIHVDDTKYGMQKTAMVKSWDDRTYDITLKAWSAKPVETVWVDVTTYQAETVITPSADNEGNSYLVYIGEGNNEPVSQDPADYALVKCSGETVKTGSSYYWGSDGVNGIEKYEGNVYIREGLSWYESVGHTSNFVPEDGVQYYGDGVFEIEIPFIGTISIPYKQPITRYEEAEYTTTYFWEDKQDAGAVARTTYKTVTTQEPFTPEGSSPIQAATDIVDVVDPRFEIVSTSPAGATVEGNKVTWTVDALSGTAEEPGFVGTITVRAKDTFVGGNNVKTNVEAQSGLKIGDNTLRAFPNQPTVNVKAELTLGNTQREIFLGEAVPNDASIPADMGATVDGVQYAWTAGEGVTGGKLPVAYIPETAQTLEYTLTGTLVMEEPTEASNANTAGHYNGSAADQYTMTANGIYTVLIHTGKLTITKQLVDDQGNPIAPHDAKQAFLFTVLKDGKRFCEVVLTPGTQTAASKTLTALPAGEYTVVEDTKWAWRYEAVGDAQQTVTISRDEPEQAVTFQDKHVNPYWLEGKDNVTNVFNVK